MRGRPDSVTDADVVAALAEGWRLTAASAAYRAVGAGSYHWSVVDHHGRAWFVTVDDLGYDPAGRGDRLAVLRRAFDTALALHHEAGLEFVVGPVPTCTGDSIEPFGPRYAMTVFPMLDGAAGDIFTHRPDQRAEVVDLLIALHRATPAVANRASPTDLALPGRDRLRQALDSLEVPWTSGPYAEPARHLLASRASRVEQMLGEFDRLVAQVRGSTAPWVVTHGEPHPGNLVRTAAGLRLVDWDTVQLAPPERDLWMLADDSDDGAGLAAYAYATGRSPAPAALALYRRWWDLADIASYLEDLRRPHRTTEDTTAALRILRGYLDE